VISIHKVHESGCEFSASALFIDTFPLQEGKVIHIISLFFHLQYSQSSWMFKRLVRTIIQTVKLPLH